MDLDKMMRDAKHLVNNRRTFYIDLGDMIEQVGSAHTGGPGTAASIGGDVRSGM
ncbi:MULTISPECIES: hypothetical protein [Micromonospora]|uniref:hypothetical protein n=1 Tax=Micromonospora TaxID=1873 RepID=UPI00159BE8BD|nr:MULTISPECIES: hypothetical protein [Micromonospora]